MMKNLFSVLLLTFIFSCTSQFLIAQQVAESVDANTSELTSIKDKLVKKYAWVKSHLNSKAARVKSVKEMETESGINFVLIESADKNVLYDAQGKVYCTDNSSLNCVEFYKLKEGKLNWGES